MISGYGFRFRVLCFKANGLELMVLGFMVLSFKVDICRFMAVAGRAQALWFPRQRVQDSPEKMVLSEKTSCPGKCGGQVMRSGEVLHSLTN